MAGWSEIAWLDHKLQELQTKVAEVEKEGAELDEKMGEVSRWMAECRRETAESIMRMTENLSFRLGAGPRAKGRRDEDGLHAREEARRLLVEG